ncbi:MAG: hypothetical protein KGS61_07050 [Verrucomicrobia bacterium]|nr:hypothetical protein [Verrucomicrobiota bacterium]
MHLISAMLRFISGIALIVFAYSTYRRIGGRVAAGEPLQIAGVTLGASPRQVAFALVVVGLIGVFLIVLGLLTLTRKRP